MVKKWIQYVGKKMVLKSTLTPSSFHGWDEMVSIKIYT